MTEYVLDWAHEARTIGERGIEFERTATADERQAIARALDILECTSLVVRYRLRPLTRGRFAFKGHIEAKVVQACVVTLEPVPAAIDEPLEVEFCPVEEIAQDGPSVFDPMAPDDPEPIEKDGRIDVGRLVFEQMAVLLEPFPRKPGAEFDPKALGDQPDLRPFAGLARLKKRE